MEYKNSIVLYFETILEEKLVCLQTSAFYSMLNDDVKSQMKNSVLEKIYRVTASYCNSIMADMLKDENPIAFVDSNLITKAEKEKLTPVITDKLISGDITLPVRMTESVERIIDNAVSFYDRMLSDLYEHRNEICDLLFGGRLFNTISSVRGSGDTHNHGKYTAIIETDQGKIVYKPRSCEIDAKAYCFMKKYFDDIIVMPKTFAYKNDFGVLEFLEKKVSKGEKEAAEYFYALGGTTAVLKMLGSKDMHVENLFACDGRLALIDIETLMYPLLKTDKGVMEIAVGEENEAELLNSVLGSCLFNQRMRNKRYVMDFSIMTNTDEMGSAPVVDGKKKNILDYREKFFEGFSDVYDKCMEMKDSILKDIEESFTDVVVRSIIFATKSYVDIILRLNSCYSYSSEDYYAQQLEKLPKLLKNYKQRYFPVLVDKEIEALMENEVPFFYTYEGSRDIYSGGELLVKDYFDKSAIDRVRDIIISLSEWDKQFEIRMMNLMLDLTPVEDKGEYPKLLSAQSCITEENAVIEAEKIFDYIYANKLQLRSGDLLWFGFNPGNENCNLMNMELYSGISGMAVFFAAMMQCAKDSKVAEKANECLDSCLKMLSRFLISEEAQDIINNPYRLAVGEGGGLAGVLRSIVLINRYCTGLCDKLIDKAKELIANLDVSNNKEADKSSGIAGLIVTLCRYKEYYTDPAVQKTIYGLAKKLVSMKNLPSGDLLVWKTLYDKGHAISGAVHGMTGIAEALFMAGKILGIDEFDAAAQDAVTFEDENYSEDLENWLDRRVPGIKRNARGNCYGAEGIGIVFKHLADQGIIRSETPRILERADKVVRRIIPFRLDHLCCGNMSSVDYYLETGDRTAAGKLLADVVKRKNENGQYKLGLEGMISNNNVTLFYGLAGIGYELIRFTDPKRFETVL